VRDDNTRSHDETPEFGIADDTRNVTGVNQRRAHGGCQNQGRDRSVTPCSVAHATPLSVLSPVIHLVPLEAGDRREIAVFTDQRSKIGLTNIAPNW
jgi:hypothetical protein